MLFMLAMILIIEVIRATAYPKEIDLLCHLRRRGGNVMDFHTRHWLDYDIVALVTLVLAITLLELTVLGILGLTYP